MFVSVCVLASHTRASVHVGVSVSVHVSGAPHACMCARFVSVHVRVNMSRVHTRARVCVHIYVCVCGHICACACEHVACAHPGTSLRAYLCVDMQVARLCSMGSPGGQRLVLLISLNKWALRSSADPPGPAPSRAACDRTCGAGAGSQAGGQVRD